jgi:hypothetical protein
MSARTTAARVRQTVALFTAGTLGTALLDPTPFRAQTVTLALVGIYAVWLDAR